MKIDFNNVEKPLFIQIAEEIEDNILKGFFLEETQIPSTTEISITLKINPGTVIKGVSLLVDEEIIYKKRGIGMFVSSGAKDKIREKRKQNFYDSYIIPMCEEATKLAISNENINKMINDYFLNYKGGQM